MVRPSTPRSVRQLRPQSCRIDWAIVVVEAAEKRPEPQPLIAVVTEKIYFTGESRVEEGKKGSSLHSTAAPSRAGRQTNRQQPRRGVARLRNPRPRPRTRACARKYAVERKKGGRKQAGNFSSLGSGGGGGAPVHASRCVHSVCSPLSQLHSSSSPVRRLMYSVSLEWFLPSSAAPRNALNARAVAHQQRHTRLLYALLHLILASSSSQLRRNEGRRNRVSMSRSMERCCW